MDGLRCFLRALGNVQKSLEQLRPTKKPDQEKKMKHKQQNDGHNLCQRMNEARIWLVGQGDKNAFDRPKAGDSNRQQSQHDDQESGNRISVWPPTINFLNLCGAA
jgi:hypothetical protein